MQCREKLEAYLREQGVAYELHHHAQAFTAQEVAQREHVPGRRVAKVVVVWADGAPAMLVLPAPFKVDLEHLAETLGAQHVRMAREDELAVVFPDCELGAMPPFGNLYDVPVYVDPRLAENDTIVVQAGTHTETISLRYADFERLVHPRTLPFARQIG
ncbi:aminoacyl-tRNA deacylase [Kallotenue papyrolyticum]|uniref:aminoacyl-tRNA deacylase n=1 Tax=Kallotenue papyrolyticum TaxID=1325125 RepID=UPI00049243C0|nr:YbaK/EbsC family protein [Kallotenue papyrolyticum]